MSSQLHSGTFMLLLRFARTVFFSGSTDPMFVPFYEDVVCVCGSTSISLRTTCLLLKKFGRLDLPFIFYAYETSAWKLSY